MISSPSTIAAIKCLFKSTKNMKKGKAVPPGSFQFLALNFNIGFIFLDSGMRLRIL